MGVDAKNATAQVAVTIAGHVYRMACAEGEEAHLQELARHIDERIEKLRRNFGEIGDQRLFIMAAITVADDLSEARANIRALEGEIAGLRAATEDQATAQEKWAESLAQSLDETTARIERLAQSLNTPGR